MTKFNGFEKYFIQKALESAIEQAEQEVKEMETKGKRSLYASGYFTLVGNELIEKVNRMTLKKHQDKIKQNINKGGVTASFLNLVVAEQNRASLFILK